MIRFLRLMRMGNLKQNLLELLSRQAQEDLPAFSGEELAARFSVTRAAVWKAVQALREEGYQIEGRRNLGYRLVNAHDFVSAPLIGRFLTPESKAFYRIECFETVSSTNTLLKARAAEGAPAGTVLIAEMQTAGRGRLGRSFYSPKGSGIYLSVLLRPDLPAANAVQLTAAAAAAGALALESAFPGLPEGSVRIKWVNDLFLDAHKICGILTEGMLSMESGKLEYAIVGIGFNLKAPEGGWPDELKGIAGGLPDGIAGNDSRVKVVSEFLNVFLELTKDLSAQRFLPEYSKRQLVAGQYVEVLRSGAASAAASTPAPALAAASGAAAASDSADSTAGTSSSADSGPVSNADGRNIALALGIDGQCRLIVRYPDGSEEHLNSGEVRIVPMTRQ